MALKEEVLGEGNRPGMQPSTVVDVKRPSKSRLIPSWLSLIVYDKFLTDEEHSFDAVKPCAFWRWLCVACSAWRMAERGAFHLKEKHSCQLHVVLSRITVFSNFILYCISDFMQKMGLCNLNLTCIHGESLVLVYFLTVSKKAIKLNETAVLGWATWNIKVCLIAVPFYWIIFFVHSETSLRFTSDQLSVFLVPFLILITLHTNALVMNVLLIKSLKVWFMQIH